MKTVAIMCQKGGAGKSTLTLNLAVAAMMDRKQTGVVDLDSQGTVAAWGDDRTGKPPEVVSGFASRLPQLLKGAATAGTEVVFLDLAPRAQGDHKLAGDLADLILIPCRPSIFDFRAIQLTWDLCHNVLRKPAWIVFSAVAPRGDRELADAAGEMTQAGFRIAPVLTHQRNAFVRSAAAGKGVLEYEPKGKGSQEIRDLYKWVNKQLNTPTGKKGDAK